MGYYAYYDHRQREGFREANSDYNLNEGSGKIVYDPSSDSRIILTIDGYDEEHGEPGGLTVSPSAECGPLPGRSQCELRAFSIVSSSSAITRHLHSNTASRPNSTEREGIWRLPLAV